MSIQSFVAGVLNTELNAEAPTEAAYIVRGYWWRADAAEPGKTYISVYRHLVQPQASVAAGARRHDLHIVVMSSKTKPGEADADIDAALDAVLDVLDKHEQLAGLVWEQAERGVIDESYPAYTISGWVGTTREQELPQ